MTTLKLWKVLFVIRKYVLKQILRRSRPGHTLLQTDNRAKRGMNVTGANDINGGAALLRRSLISLKDSGSKMIASYCFHCRKVTKQKVADISIVQLNVLLTRFQF